MSKPLPEIERCKMCHGEPIMLYRATYYDCYVWMQCRDCLRDGPHVRAGDGAILAWNRAQRKEGSKPL